MNIKEYKKNDLIFISISNKSNYEVTLSNIGASIYAIKINEDYLTQTPIDIEVFKKTYHGKTIGRIANRVGKGKIDINGITYTLDLNEKESCLHGGKDGLSTKKFNYLVADNKDNVKVTFFYTSSHLEEGLPGNVNFKITYTVYNNKNDLLVEFEATSDKDTVVALTNHAYFTLASATNKELSLLIKADKYIYPNPKNLIPIEERGVNEIMDFRTLTKLNKNIDHPSINEDTLTKGYDHHYCFTNVNIDNPQVTLINDKYQLDIYTDYNGVQIYSDNYPSDDKWYGTTEKIRRSIAIEPQDSILKREILKKDELYKRFIKYSFTKK